MTNDNEENFNEEIILQNYKNDDKFFYLYHYCYKSNKLECQKKIIKSSKNKKNKKRQ